MKSFHRRSTRPAPTLHAPARPPHAGAPRADMLLVARGLAPSRTAARRLIEAGRVFAKVGVTEGNPRGTGETAVTKPAQELPETAELRIVDDAADRYVSRGGIKLAGALAHAGIEVRGRRCLDVGQSTGGFTDCLLQNGAAHVVGIDVGHGQLHPTLAAHPRVEPFEGINARDLEKSALAARRPAPLFDLIVADVSFISLTLVLPQLPAFLASDGDMLLLVKPQFEVGPDGVGKGGIVRDAALYGEVEARLRDCCAEQRLRVVDWFESPISGTDGNREFFLHAQHEKN
ncbi:MAG: TlyA family RNA methyltransferase [Sulfurisoma sp.]|nr:TlyA family RNA methyltransferase [Sulfurisoma sp.]